ncbi:MAG: hypothetical protein ACHQUA_01775 [Microgenomates group bacterium]
MSERDLTVAEARKVAREFSQAKLKGSGISDDARIINADNLRAMNGICGECCHLKPKLATKKGRQVVDLWCKKDHLPNELYQDLGFTEEAVCADQSPI